MECEDLIWVTWRLDARETGTVIACWIGRDGGVETDTFEIHRGADWAQLPGPVARAVQRHGGRCGERIQRDYAQRTG